MDLKLKKHYNDVLLDAIVFGEDYLKYISDLEISDSLLDNIEERIKFYSEKEICDESFKNNMLKLICYLKFETQEFGIKNNDKLNELIFQANSAVFSKVGLRCYVELDTENRLDGVVYWLGDFKEYIRQTKTHDYIVLKSLLCSEEEYDQMVLFDSEDQICLNEYYFLSINKIINDHPEILKDEEAVSRIKNVIEINNIYKNLKINTENPKTGHQLRKIYRMNKKLEKKMKQSA